jgi:metallo-beta-lactamase class B
MRRVRFAVVCLLVSFVPAHAASIECSQCEAWNKDQAPFHIFGNTYYVGTHGLSAVLVTSDSGHVLIDGALPQSAPLIARHVEQLGFRMSDVKVILNSHPHVDHAGGIAELQKMSGATVYGSDNAVTVLKSGKAGRNDPQSGVLPEFPGAENVQALGARKSIRVGALEVNVVHTPGHTPGGTTWTWRSCEGDRCLDLVYGDSLNAVADETFKYSGDARYPTAEADMRASIAAVEALPCDILIAAHPEFSGLWSVFDERGRGDRARAVDRSACKRYGAAARERLEKRLQAERAR